MNLSEYPASVKQALEFINRNNSSKTEVLQIKRKILADKGVCFICFGDQFIPRLMVAIHSLRREYNGAICVFYYENNNIYDNFFNDMKVDIIDLTIADKALSKVELIQTTPYKYTILLDADTLTLKPIDLLFDKIKKQGIFLHNFMDFTPNNSQKDIKLEQFNKIDSLYTTALQYQRAVSGAIFGFSKENAMLEPLTQIVQYGHSNQFINNFDCTLQLLAPHFKHFLVGAKNAMSCQYNNTRIDPIIIHFHNNQHINSGILSRIWKDEYHCLEDTYKPSFKSDISLKNYLQKIN